MLKKRNHSFVCISKPQKLTRRQSSLYKPPCLKRLQEAVPEPLPSIKLKLPKPAAEYIIQKPAKDSNSVKNFVDCTNILLRRFTKLGPMIRFSSISSASKLSNHKIIETGGGLILRDLTKRNTRRNSNLSIASSSHTKENRSISPIQ